MPVFPFFRYPYYNNYYGYNYYNKFNNNFYKNNINSSINKGNIILDTNESEDINSSDPEHVFEIFGIKLYFDDVLIISLLILLYNEGVKDYSLFISLVLLLIS